MAMLSMHLAAAAAAAGRHISARRAIRPSQ
jgi:hypothetical protein